MNRDELIARFANLCTWKRGGQRAPHKPLLVLLALGELQNGRRELRFKDIEKQLSDLLRDFGPPRKAHHPEYPFWRLQHDDVWEVITASDVKLGADGSPSKAELLRVSARGQFKENIRSALTADPSIIPALAKFLLESHFPESLHQDILNAVGLDLAEPHAGGGRRDPHFRRMILTAYEHQCAVCGLQLLLCGSPVALEAAHIQWHQAKGPSIVPNGLCLCCLHHKLFDLGAITVSEKLTVIVSDQATGQTGFREHLMTHHGRQIKKTIHVSDLPSPDFIKWHHKEVFRGKPRPN